MKCSLRALEISFLRMLLACAAQGQTHPLLSAASTNGNGVLNAIDYCATPHILDQTCIQNAALAAGLGQQIFVPAGVYNGTSSMISKSQLHLVLDPGASINYPLNIRGHGFYRSKL